MSVDLSTVTEKQLLLALILMQSKSLDTEMAKRVNSILGIDLFTDKNPATAIIVEEPKE